MNRLKDRMIMAQNLHLDPFSPEIDAIIYRERVAAALGGDVDANKVRCPSPGRGRKDRSCVIKIDHSGGFFIYDCEGSAERAYATFSKKLKLIAPPRKDHTGLINEIWRRSFPARGTVVERYLRSRGINLLPDCLKYHPALYHGPSKRTFQSMVAPRFAVDGSLVALHRTFLTSAGAKIPHEPPRMDLGPAKGTAVRLSNITDELLVGEGIETTLSAMQLWSLPGWAAGGAPNMLRNLVLPPEVRRVTLLVDGDPEGAKACTAATARWELEGRRVMWRIAPAGKDFNDVLLEEAAK